MAQAKHAVRTAVNRRAERASGRVEVCASGANPPGMTATCVRVLRRETLGLLALAGFAAAVLAIAPAASQLPAAGEPVLELAPLYKGGDLAKARDAASALGAAVEKLPGFVRADMASASGKAGVVVRATVWASVGDAENASLAVDGSAKVAALVESVDAEARTVSHFRRLRESVYSQDPAGHLEVVVFRTKPGTTREANLALFDKAEAEFATGEGLRAHSLWLASDGRWVHLLRWRSAADYETTGKALFAKPGVGGWIRSLDFQRFVVTRGDMVSKSA